MKRYILLTTAIFIFLVASTVYAAKRDLQLTGEVAQEIVACSDNVVNSTQAFTDSGLSATITPIYTGSMLKISYTIPRFDVSHVSLYSRGSTSPHVAIPHSSRVAAARIVDDANGYGIPGSSGIVGRVLTGATTKATTATGHIYSTSYYQLVSKVTKTFSLEFGPAVAGVTEARLRGDRGAYCIILQEIRPKNALQASVLGSVDMVAQTIGSIF